MGLHVPLGSSLLIVGLIPAQLNIPLRDNPGLSEAVLSSATGMTVIKPNPESIPQTRNNVIPETLIWVAGKLVVPHLPWQGGCNFLEGVRQQVTGVQGPAAING